MNILLLAKVLYKHKRISMHPIIYNIRLLKVFPRSLKRTSIYMPDLFPSLGTS